MLELLSSKWYEQTTIATIDLIQKASTYYHRDHLPSKSRDGHTATASKVRSIYTYYSKEQHRQIGNSKVLNRITSQVRVTTTFVETQSQSVFALILRQFMIAEQVSIIRQELFGTELRFFIGVLCYPQLASGQSMPTYGNSRKYNRRIRLAPFLNQGVYIPRSISDSFWRHNIYAYPLTCSRVAVRCVGHKDLRPLKLIY